ncbi:MAG: DNA polymerase III subunit beta [Isosphaeraceae bacterium]|nr:MAG: DNA polymerase III subunit beta [Isosphaeraceae bacterium]
MKALCNREGLLAGFGMASLVAPARSPKTILQSVKLDVSENGSELLATDLEVGIRHRVLGVKVDEPGAVILPTQRFGQILRSLSDEELAIELQGNQVVVRGRHAQFKLPTDDASLYPELPDFGASAYYVVTAADLRRGIRRTVFATDVESTRYALGGVLFELKDERLTLVATDGRRLARQVVGVDVEGKPGLPESQPVVPVKALKLVERSLQDEDPPVHLVFQGNHVLMRTEEAVIYSRLVEGRFPRYQDVFPAQVEVRIPLEAGPLLRATEQASIVTSEESRAVDFHFGPGVLRLTSQAPDQGSSDIELAIAYEDRPVSILFDPRYLVEALRVLDESAAVTAELVDPRNAAVFRTEDDYTYVVMPLTRER